MDVPQTGGYQNWKTITATANFSAGNQTLKIFSSKTYGWNINWFEFIQQSSSKAISNKSEDESFKVTPDPFTDRFALSINNSITGNMNIQILDSTSTVRKEFNIEKKEAQFTQVYLSAEELPAGEYNIKVKMNEWMRSKKISKK